MDDIFDIFVSEIPTKVLSQDETNNLIQQYQEHNDIDAFHTIIKYNLRLVISVAQKLHNQYGVELGDAVQSGTIGLMTAIERFDIAKQYRLSTYAFWWIRQAIQESAGEHNAIRLPSGARKQFHALVKNYESFVAQEHREPSTEEVNSMSKLSPHLASQLLATRNKVASLDLGDSDSNFIPDTKPDVETQASQSWLSTRLQEIMPKFLNKREIIVLNGRFADQPKSLQELGVIISLTKERVRQIEIAALKKLQQSPEIKDLAAEFISVQEGDVYDNPKT